MITHTDADIQYGLGAFDHAMRAQTAVPGRAVRISPGAAIGILSAAMRSGLPATLLNEVIARDFAHSAPLLRRVAAMYEGEDWDINLWHRQPTGFYKLATALCRPGQAQWRYDPKSTNEDF